MQILHNQSLKAYNTFWVSNTVNTLCFLQTIEDLKEFQQLPGKKTILGWGSNILITQDLDVVWINQFNQEPQIISSKKNKDEIMTKVWSGYSRDAFVQWTLDQWLYGLENMALIPGTVWAWALGNIGAYGAEVKDFIEEVEYIDLTTFQTHTLSNAECEFAYRRSKFKTMSDYFISSVTFSFPDQSDYQINTNYPDIQKVIQEQELNTDALTPKEMYQIICGIRTAKMPSRDEFGTAGSFFKNPIVTPEKLEQLQTIDPDIKYFSYGDNYKVAAWYLLDKLWYKWKIIWKVWCYRNQALILVNQWGSGEEVDEFAKKLEEHVAQAYGIQLEREVIRL